MRSLKLIIFAIPFATGIYFAFKSLWQDYLSDKKRKSLSVLTHSTIGFGAVLTGTLMGNYLQLTKANRIKSHFNPTKLKVFLLLTLCSAVTSEMIDRNVFVWGAGSLSLAAYEI
jgi:hypothetical protein